MARGTLEVSGMAGASGPVVMLAGEADLTNSAQLSTFLSAQLCDGARQLTIDVSGLRFADSASIRTLVLTARTLKERGGSLLLLRPQQPVARVLELPGADQVIAVRGIGTASP